MKMIDIGKKDVTEREAIVRGTICLEPKTIQDIKNKKIPKGDVLETAKLAGIMAAKKTPDLVMLCHPIPLEYVSVEFSVKEKSIEATTTVKARARTGVEMEAFTATALALVTIYDMCKFMDRTAVITDVKLIRKSGGKSGLYERK